MARSGIPWLLPLGALLFDSIAVYLGPSWELLLSTYGINIPSSLTSPPIAIDHSRDIRYTGSRVSSVEHFQNIFYAEDTTGKNCFAPPVPIEHAKGSVIDSTQPGAWCPQGTGDVLPFTSRVTNISENCLSLRIARPQGTKGDAKLPVMVWIHGGKQTLIILVSSTTYLPPDFTCSISLACGLKY